VIRGMYTATTGMVAEQNRQNVVANNLANANTTGFKADNTTNTTFDTMLLHACNKRGKVPIGSLGLGVQISPAYTDFSSGPLEVTDNPNDLAIEGDALFAVDVNGAIRFTRAGHFGVDQDQYLVTTGGHRVLGEQGPIQVGAGFQVTEAGDVVQDGQVTDRLRLAATQGMVKEGDSLYRSEQVQPAGKYRIFQGMLEGSNVNTIRQMLEMINLTRSYEANQKALTAHDETLGRAVTEMTR
jgi:flagellar basal-body rod protein FlgF